MMEVRSENRFLHPSGPRDRGPGSGALEPYSSPTLVGTPGGLRWRHRWSRYPTAQPGTQQPGRPVGPASCSRLHLRTGTHPEWVEPKATGALSTAKRRPAEPGPLGGIFANHPPQPPLGCKRRTPG